MTTPHPQADLLRAILPDGSAFALASYPLPKDHWLYAPREYEPGSEEPKELPPPILTHALRAEVEAAVRYAIRCATMCGKETDFDPDALVKNAVYALCGPFKSVAAGTTHPEAPAAQGDALDQGVREELSIGKAINRAARDLPEGWEIRIDLERHAGVVFLIDPDGNETMSEGGEPFSDQINTALDAARGAQGENNEPV